MTPGIRPDPRQLFLRTFEEGSDLSMVAAPGRVNLIGEHIDYHGLPVLPITLGRRVRVAFRARKDRRKRAISDGYGTREFEWHSSLVPATPGDWENYLRAAAQAISRKWGTGCGVEAALVSDLPPAAGLSSSSALIVAFTLALLKANGRQPRFEELMDILPDGEQFVGTRGFTCLASRVRFVDRVPAFVGTARRGPIRLEFSGCAQSDEGRKVGLGAGAL
jgi:galactokinase